MLRYIHKFVKGFVTQLAWERLERAGRPRPTLMLALLAVGLATALREFTLTSALLCLLGVSVVAQAFGTRSGLLFILPCAALLYGVVIPLNPVLIPLVSTGSFVLVSSAFCLLQGRLPAARRGESRALALVALSRHLSEALREDEVWSVLQQHLQREFGEHRLLSPDESARGWVMTLPDGLGSVVFEQEPEERQLAEAFLLYAAQAVGRLRLAERMREADLARAREKLHSALLNSISHDLRTPLVSIKGALSGLLEGSFSNNPVARRDLVENALAEADRLHRLMENLLQMTRLEAGALRVTSKLYDLGEVISAVLKGLAPQLQGREVELEIPEELPLIPQDPILIGQVLRNLLDNALKYSPAGSPLRVEVRPAEDRIETAVLDRGPGIPEDEEARVFEKFFRGRGQNAQGSGLGLSICEGLIEAHGGRIEVSPRTGGGTRVTFTLPLKEGECPRF